MRISTENPFHEDAGDYLNSQQTTPTAETYSQTFPPPIKKEKPKYEFHSPSELLQDPTMFHPEVPEPPASLDPLPSVTGSLVSEKGASPTDEDRSVDAVAETTKDKPSGISSFLGGAGLASVVGAAVSAAVRGKEGVSDAPHDALPDQSTKEVETPSTATGELGFGNVVDAAVAAAVEEPATPHPDVAASLDSSERKIDVLEESQQEAKDTPADEPVPMVSKKQKRKEKKKKQKGKDNDESNEATPAEAATPAVEISTTEVEAERAEPTEPGTAESPAAAVEEQPITSEPKEPEKFSNEQQPPADSSRDIIETEVRDVSTTETEPQAPEMPKPPTDSEAPSTSSIVEQAADGDTNDQPTHVSAEPEDSSMLTKAQRKKKKKQKKSQSLSESVSLESPQPPSLEEETATPATVADDEPKVSEKRPWNISSAPGPLEMDEPKELETRPEAEPEAEPEAQPEALDKPKDLEAQPEDPTPLDSPAPNQQPEETVDTGTILSKSQKKKNKKKQKGKSLSLTEEPAELPEPEESTEEAIATQPTSEDKTTDASGNGNLSPDAPTSEGNIEQTSAESVPVSSEPANLEEQTEDVKEDMETAQAVASEIPVDQPASEEIAGDIENDKSIETDVQAQEPVQDTPEATAEVPSQEKSEEQPVESSTKLSKNQKKKKKKRQSLMLDVENEEKPTPELPETSPPPVDGAEVAPETTENDKGISDQFAESTPEKSEEKPEDVIDSAAPADLNTNAAEIEESDNFVDAQETNDNTALETSEPTTLEQSPAADDIVESKELPAEAQEPAAVQEAQKPEESSELKEITSEAQEPTQVEDAQKPEDSSEPKELLPEVKASSEQPAVDDSELPLSKKEKKKKKKGKQNLPLPWEDESPAPPAEKAAEPTPELEPAPLTEEPGDLVTPIEDTTSVAPVLDEQTPETLNTQATDVQEPASTHTDNDLVAQDEKQPDPEPSQAEPATSSKSKKKKGKKGKRVSWIDEPENTTETQPEPSTETQETATAEPEPSSTEPDLSPATESDPTPAEFLSEDQLPTNPEADSPVAVDVNTAEIEGSTPVEAEVSPAVQAESPPEDIEGVSHTEIEKADSTSAAEAEETEALEQETTTELPEEATDLQAEQDIKGDEESRELPTTTEQTEPVEVDEQKPSIAAEVEDSGPTDSKKRKKDKKKDKKRKKATESLGVDEEEAPQKPADEGVNEDAVLPEPSEAPISDNTEKEESGEVQLPTAIDKETDASNEKDNEDKSLDTSEEPKPADVTQPTDNDMEGNLETSPEQIKPVEAIEADDEWTQETTKSKKKKDKKKKRKSLQTETTQEEAIGDSSKDLDNSETILDSTPTDLEATAAPEISQDATKNDDITTSLEETSQTHPKSLGDEEPDVQVEEAKEVAEDSKSEEQPISQDVEPSVDSSTLPEVSQEAELTEESPVQDPSAEKVDTEKAADLVGAKEPTDIDPPKDIDEEPMVLTGKAKKKAKKNKKKRESMSWDEPEAEATAETESVPAPAPQEPDDSSAMAAPVEQPANEKDDTPAEALPQEVDSKSDPTTTDEPQPTTERTEENANEDTVTLENVDTALAEPERQLSAKEKRKEKKKKRQTLDLSNEEPTPTDDITPDAQPDAGENEKMDEETKDESLLLEPNDDEFSLAGKKKKKGKKNKRQSSNWEDEVIEAVAGDESGEIATQATEAGDGAEEPKESVSRDSPSEETTVPTPVPETPESTLQETPVEVDGKDTFQSSDKNDIDTKEKDFDWTDNMVSSQVQAPTEDSPYPVPSPTLIDRDNVFEPTPAEDNHKPAVPDATVESQKLASNEQEATKDVSTTDVDPSTQEPDSEFWSTSTGKGSKNKKKKKQKSKLNFTDLDEDQNAESKIATHPPTEFAEDPKDQSSMNQEESTTADNDNLPSSISEEQKDEEYTRMEEVIEPDVTHEGETTAEAPALEEIPSGDNEAEQGLTHPITESAEEKAEHLSEALDNSGTSAFDLDLAEQPSVSAVEHIVEDPTMTEAEHETETTIPTEESTANPKLEDSMNPTEVGEQSEETPKELPAASNTEESDAVKDISPETAKEDEGVNNREEVETQTPVTRKLSKKEKKKQKKKGKQTAEIDEEENNSAGTQEPAAVDKPEEFNTEPSAGTPVPTMDEQSPALTTADVETATTQEEQDHAEPETESAWTQPPLGRKVSRKEKRKNAKKNLFELEGEDKEIFNDFSKGESTHLAMDDPVVQELGAAEPVEEAPSADATFIPTQVSLDPFDAADGDEEATMITAEPVDVDMDLHVEDKKETDLSQDTNEMLHRTALEKEDDLTVATDLFGEPSNAKSEDTALEKSPKKQDKKKKKKGKTTSVQELERVAEPDEVADSEKIPTETPAEPDTSFNDQLLTRRDSKSSKAKGKKKKKRESQADAEQYEDQSQTTLPTADPAIISEEHHVDPIADESGEKSVQSWPSIEFDKERDGAPSDSSKRSPPSDHSASHNKDTFYQEPESMIEEFIEATPAVETQTEKSLPPSMDREMPDASVEGNPASSQARDVDLISEIALAAAGFRSSPKLEDSDVEPNNSGTATSKGKKVKDLTNIYEPQPSKAGENTTSKISNIFPGLERATFRRPSPKPVAQYADDMIPATNKDHKIRETSPFDKDAKMSMTTEKTREISDPSTSPAPARESSRSPMQSTSRDHSPSLLFNSSPSTRFDPPLEAGHRSDTPPTGSHRTSSGSLHRTKSIHGHHGGATHGWKHEDELTRSNSPGMIHADHPGLSPPRTPLDPIKEHDGAHSSSPRLTIGEEPYVLPRPDSRNSVRSSRSLRRTNRSISSELRAVATDSPGTDKDQKRSSGAGRGAGAGWEAGLETIRSQPPKAAEQQTHDDDLDRQHFEDIPSSSTYDPVTDKGKRPARGMSDVYVSHNHCVDN
jgi:hypothetical protein